MSADPILMAAILQASITAAGLILAAYALVLPVAKSILEDKAQVYTESFLEFQKKTKKLKPHEFSEDIKSEITDMMETISNFGKLPLPLSMAMGFLFFIYMGCAILSVFWFSGYNKVQLDGWVPTFFVIASIFFAIVGYFIFKMLSDKMEKELDNIKKEVSEKIQDMSEREHEKDTL